MADGNSRSTAQPMRVHIDGEDNSTDYFITYAEAARTVEQLTGARREYIEADMRDGSSFHVGSFNFYSPLFDEQNS